MLAARAMATRFELVLPGADAARLRAAGEEALGVVRRLDAQLSRYRAASDIGRIIRCAATGPVPVEPELFALLLRARELSERSGGAFDITVGPLLHCWGLAGREGGRVPDPAELEHARAGTGMALLELDERRRTIRFARPGVSIDLGAIGKGYALAQAALTLRELGITSALLHGGTSSVTTIGAPPDAAAWRVAIEHPGAAAGPLALVPLVNRSLSVSAVWGKAFHAGDVRYGHVLAPRSGCPAQGAVLAAVACADATAADALSTALLVLGPAAADRLVAPDPDLAALVLGAGPAYRTWSRGITLRPRVPAGGNADVA
ncbi:MAG: FAD:protein FMN transferase [Gemmatimonadetes bacterium]|nr:FAD:protein FMN transferase [Gemmatimonadota bacterium]